VKLLVLGPNGQLGGDVMEAAATGSISATGVGRDVVDITDRDALWAFLRATSFDALLNATSYHKTDEVEGNADRAMAVNAVAPALMAEICAEKGARFLHVSTDYVFGGDAARTTPLEETDPTAPVNVYGLSKQFGETLIGLVGGDSTVLRVASLFGVRGASGKGGNFVETMIRFGWERGALKVVEDQVMSPTATAFIARAILAFLEREGPPGVYHCVNGGSASWAEFARAIVEACAIPAVVTGCTTADWPAPARRPAYSALDNARLAGVVGPIPHWRDALATYLTAKGHV
jgi:dTDP-4-dehydrorhamnose reductase